MKLSEQIAVGQYPDMRCRLFSPWLMSSEPTDSCLSQTSTVLLWHCWNKPLPTVGSFFLMLCLGRSTLNAVCIPSFILDTNCIALTNCGLNYVCSSAKSMKDYNNAASSRRKCCTWCVCVCEFIQKVNGLFGGPTVLMLFICIHRLIGSPNCAKVWYTVISLVWNVKQFLLKSGLDKSSCILMIFPSWWFWHAYSQIIQHKQPNMIEICIVFFLFMALLCGLAYISRSVYD